MTNGEEKVHLDLPASWVTSAVVVGVIALGVCALGAIAQPADFFRAYLVAYAAILALSMGSLVLRMIGYLTDATWCKALGPILESATNALPLLALLFLPLLLGLDRLYPWDMPEVVKENPLISKKTIYLNPTWFIVRAAVCLLLWNGLAFLIHSLYRKASASGTAADLETLRGACGFGLVLFAVSFTVAAVDWFMSLEPEWWSAIYGVMLGVGQILMAYSFGVLVYLSLMLRAPGGPWARDKGPIHLTEHYGQQLLRDFGNLLLAFTLIWAYMSFSQYLLIYSGNEPEEAVWYRPRTHGGWEYLILTIVGTQFALPFFLLLSKDLKRNPRTLILIALLIFSSRFLDLTWLLVPAFPGKTGSLFWMLPLAFLGLGGLWAALFLTQLRRRVLILKVAGHVEAFAHE